MIPNQKLIQITQTLIPTLYPYQKKLIKNDKHELIINKSRQTGISYCVACWSLIQAIFNNKTELIISPSLRQSKHMMDYIYTHLNKLRNDFKIEIREETKTSLIFKENGQIHSLPNSANTIRGYPADDIYVDEFAHFTNGTDKEIIEALTPSLSRGGNITYISTPFGDQNLFYQYWNERDDISKLCINWRECPDLTPKKMQEIQGIIGLDAFNQEYENQFLSDMEGQEFPSELIKKCINHELTLSTYPEQALQKQHIYIGGLDIGRTHDLTALIIMEKTLENQYKMIYKKTMKNTPYKEQYQQINYILSNYHFSDFWVDESGIGNEMAEKLKHNHRARTISFNNENKQEMVNNLKTLMQNDKIQIPDDIQLINSIRAIKRIYTPSNYLRFDSDRDSEIGHADLFWALALAVYKQRKTGGGFRFG